MKALILNSGIGKRMGDLTKNTNKCMAPITEEATVIDLQLKKLAEVGVKKVLITTGPFAESLEKYVVGNYPELDFEFVQNDLYDKTNYIYSIALAHDRLRDDDIVLMHGDLVFETSVLADIIAQPVSSMVVDKALALPEKDFKAEVDASGFIKRVGIDFFENSYAAQPLYKLKKEDFNIWLDKILEFCEEGTTGVYAENAFNTVSDKVRIKAFDVEQRVCAEVDTLEDLENIRKIKNKLI